MLFKDFINGLMSYSLICIFNIHENILKPKDCIFSGHCPHNVEKSKFLSSVGNLLTASSLNLLPE